MRQFGARPVDVLQSATRSLRGKSLADDLVELEAHNRRAAQERARRAELLDDLDVAHAPVPWVDPVHLLGHDVARTLDLLEDPWPHIDDVVPTVHAEPVIATWTNEQRSELERHLRRLLTGLPDRGGSVPTLARQTIRPWGALIRTACLLLEWARALEKVGSDRAPELARAKAALYQLREGCLRGAAELNLRTLQAAAAAATAAPEATLPRAVADAVARVRRPGTDPAVNRYRATDPELAASWLGLKTIAAELAEVQPTQPIGGIIGERLAQAFASIGAAAREAVTGPQLVGAFLAGVRAAPDPEDAIADLAGALAAVQERRTELGRAAAIERAGQVLDSLDRHLLPLHQTLPVTSGESIRYLTVSGLADTPLAQCFRWPDGVDRPSAAFHSLRAAGPTAGPGTRVAVDPATKLAGNQLGNFAAFLDATWRANDWMWGQLDAASTLLDVLLPPGKAAPRDLEPRLVEQICTASFPPVGDAETIGWASELDGLAAERWEALKPLVEIELAGGTRPPLAPSSATRAALLHRRHLEILARAVSRGREPRRHRPDADLRRRASRTGTPARDGCRTAGAIGRPRRSACAPPSSAPERCSPARRDRWRGSGRCSARCSRRSPGSSSPAVGRSSSPRSSSPG
ncbi:MAG: DUF3376 domain-containing protein [Acidimicrobiales bacterium]